MTTDNGRVAEVATDVVVYDNITARVAEVAIDALVYDNTSARVAEVATDAVVYNNTTARVAEVAIDVVVFNFARIQRTYQIDADIGSRLNQKTYQIDNLTYALTRPKWWIGTIPLTIPITVLSPSQHYYIDAKFKIHPIVTYTIDSLLKGNYVRVTQEFIEATLNTIPDVRVTQEYIEVPHTLIPDVRLTQAYIEVPHTLIPDMRVTQEYIETLIDINGTADERVTQVYMEVVVQS